MLADFDPGTLTGFYIVLLGGFAVIFSLICGIVMRLLNKPKAYSRWLATAGVFIVLGTLLAVLSIHFGKIFGWL